MRKIFISAGHSNVSGQDRGAFANGQSEGVLASELRALIATKLSNIYGITAIVDEDRNALSATLRAFRNLTQPDSIVVDIHFNAAAPQATGTEVLVPSPASAFEMTLAGEIAKQTSLILGIANRGVKSELQSHHGRLGWMRLTGENILLEVCFITNPTDLAKYEAEKVKLATCYAAILHQFARA